jgi:hypothetical protein
VAKAHERWHPLGEEGREVATVHGVDVVVVVDRVRVPMAHGKGCPFVRALLGPVGGRFGGALGGPDTSVEAAEATREDDAPS